MNYFIVDNTPYQPPKIVNEYYHRTLHGGSSKPATDDIDTSEGMTNYSSSCWMISVIQALRASSVFQHLYGPSHGKKSAIQQELFHLFDILEGKNGQKKRLVNDKETVHFKKLLIKEGLPAGMDDAYLEEPFLKFLLKKLSIPSIEYLANGKKKKETILTLRIKEQKEPRELQALIRDQKITFKTVDTTPKFLPIYIDRPEEKYYSDKKHYTIEASRVPVIATSTIEIPVGKKKASFALTSIVIGRDTKGHAYTYEMQHDAKQYPVWVEYNDREVIIHQNPATKKRRPNSNLTPFIDASKHSAILIYEFTYL